MAVRLLDPPSSVASSAGARSDPPESGDLAYGHALAKTYQCPAPSTHCCNAAHPAARRSPAIGQDCIGIRRSSLLASDFRTPAKRSRHARRARTSGLPRAQPSRCARWDGCIARTMRKPDRTTIPAVAALLLSSDLRLLVRHGSDSRADPRARDRRRPPNCVLPPTGGC
jgi:hypothetical protein